ncbi:hypothetical protein [Enterococcus cecorum]|uniref:hypothetical protein n=1 Tax=Enterococcus cecorum TaxID=44008 RepID=UPI001FADFC4E|nr:hypothetical protein [Enterococcus cecorum]MCJ0538811.1 hypothetical protein [Enterococcus cecorum]MCJ0546394.1 hypothetical protein [Enterococcus cecorum]MCJ0551099.1 hypothetical protein [Enterococcus cecorum]MCJ0569271.1 hypothetical protein [Enterococcus cecorum]
MLTVSQAMEKFKQAKVPQNEELLRRWLRKGKIEGAVIHSKREGWLIPEDSIKSLIEEKKKKVQAKNKYQKAYNDGYQQAIDDFRANIRKWIVFGYEKSGSIKRSEFRQIAPLNSDKYFKFVDQHYFARGVAKPRPSTDYFYSEGFFCYPIGNIVIDSQEAPFNEIYEEEKHQHIDTLAILMLSEYFRSSYLETK